MRGCCRSAFNLSVFSYFQSKAAQKQFSIDEYDEFSDTESEEKDSGTRSDTDAVFSPPGTPARRASSLGNSPAPPSLGNSPAPPGNSTSLGNSPAPPSIPASPRPPSPSILGAPKCVTSEPAADNKPSEGTSNGDSPHNSSPNSEGDTKSQEGPGSSDTKTIVKGSESESKNDSQSSSTNPGAQIQSVAADKIDQSQGSGSKVTECTSGSGSKVTQGSGSKVTECSSEDKGDLVPSRIEACDKQSKTAEKTKTAEKLTKKLSDSEIKTQVDGPSDFLDHSFTSSDSSDESFSTELRREYKTRKQTTSYKTAKINREASLQKQVDTCSVADKKGSAQLTDNNRNARTEKTYRENGITSDLHISADSSDLHVSADSSDRHVSADSSDAHVSADSFCCESGNESSYDSATDCASTTCNDAILDDSAECNDAIIGDSAECNDAIMDDSAECNDAIMDDSAELGECDECSTDEDCEDFEDISSDKDSVKSGHIFRCPRYSRLQARMSYSAPNSPVAARSPARDLHRLSPARDLHRLTSDDLALTSQGQGHDLALTSQGQGHLKGKRKIGPRSRSRRKDSGGGYNSDSVTMEPPPRKLRRLKVKLEDIGKNPDFKKYMKSKNKKKLVK